MDSQIVVCVWGSVLPFGATISLPFCLSRLPGLAHSQERCLEVGREGGAPNWEDAPSLTHGGPPPGTLAPPSTQQVWLDPCLSDGPGEPGTCPLRGGPVYAAGCLVIQA